jgi:hypothetical protein
LAAFFDKTFGSKKVPHLKFILLKTIQQRNLKILSVLVEPMLERKKKRFVKMFIGFLDTAF